MKMVIPSGGPNEVGAEILYSKRPSITPTVGGTGTTERILTAAAANAVVGARVALNALDLVSAGTALKNRFPDVKAVDVSETILIESDEALTAVYVVGISTAANTGGDVIAYNETVEATIRAEIIQFDFDPTDDVRMIELSLASLNNGLSAATVPHPITAILRIEGYSYA